MTDKKEKVTEMTNPLIAAFLKLQETNPENMFEAAKKAKKDYDKDGKVESEKDEVWGSRFRAAKAAGKMKEDAENDKLPKDWGEEVEQVDEAKVRSVTVQSGSAPAVPTKPAVGKSYSQMSDEEKKHFNAYTDKVAGMIKSKYRKEEVEFSEAELAHFAAVLEVGSVTPMAPTRPDQVNANDKSDRVSGRDITDSVQEAKKKVEEPSSERDARQHIQVVAGQAAAGREMDFKHNNGKSTKIGPEMGRKITAHLNGLKPAERQAKVKAMHDSPEGMKF